MKKILVLGLLLSSLICCGWAAVSFADEYSPQEIQTLKDAAVALKATNPDLGMKLGEFADQEAAEQTASEDAEIVMEDGADLLNEAAAALETSNPQLAEALHEYADRGADDAMDDDTLEEGGNEE